MKEIIEMQDIAGDQGMHRQGAQGYNNGSNPNNALLILAFLIIIIVAILVELNPPSGKDPDDILGAKKPTPNHVHSKIHTDWLLIIMMMTIISVIGFISLVKPLASPSIKGKRKSKEVEREKGIEMTTPTPTPTP